MRTKKYIVNALLLAFAMIGFTQCNSNLKEKTSESVTSSDTTENTDSASDKVSNLVAYVNIDTLLHNYQYARDLSEALIQQSSNDRAVFDAKQKEFQKLLDEYRYKMNNNAFLSTAAQKSSYDALSAKETELRELQERQNQHYINENRRVDELLRDKIFTFLKEYNKKKKYKIIFSNVSNDNVLIAEPECDITEDVTRQLNAEYTKK